MITLAADAGVLLESFRNYLRMLARIRLSADLHHSPRSYMPLPVDAMNALIAATRALDASDLAHAAADRRGHATIDCGACRRACPVACISGEPRQVHTIDQSRCIKCGACFRACRFAAVKRGALQPRKQPESD